MTTRPVLLDGSFIAAVLDSDNPSHAAAVALYASLIDNYETGADRLFALSSVLADYPAAVRRGPLAPIITEWVAGQHRRAAAEIAAASPEVALTMVMLRRERFRAVATALPDFDRFDIEVLGVTTGTDNIGIDTATGPEFERTPRLRRHNRPP